MQCSMSFATRRLTPMVRRRGFTLPEILIVVVMISILALVAVPRFATANGRRHMESARMRVAAALATARAAAIQKGEPVRFILGSDSVIVRRRDGVTGLVSPVPIYTLYKVRASWDAGFGTPLQVDFNARGFATLPSTLTIRLKRTGVPDDSVVVYQTGMVKQR
jgi:prepilin-type N-terminal cleavage/methylation domain-containing protein